MQDLDQKEIFAKIPSFEAKMRQVRWVDLEILVKRKSGAALIRMPGHEKAAASGMGPWWHDD